jgi:hypothetical protein
MIPLLILGIRLALFYLLVRVVWSLIHPKNMRQNNVRSPRKKQRIERFDTSGQNVTDAEFKDINE